MAENASDVLVDVLREWGVEVVFGLPGDGINGIIEALRKRRDEIRFVQVRHEEAAAFMACGYAKWTGKLGVCVATSGPGGIHLLNGLYDAKLDQAPVLAITGLQFHDLIDTYTQQDVELDKLFMDVACYNARVMGPAHIENVAHLACRAALGRRGVAHITVPVDVQDEPVKRSERSKRNVPNHTAAGLTRWTTIPDGGSMAKAADLLNGCEKIVIMAGRGSIGAGDELEAAAEKLGAVIVKPLLGKMAVPDDSPYTTGGVGLLGTAPSQNALENCDGLLIAGSSFPYIEYYPKPGQARCVQIDVDAARISLRYPADVGLVGDAKATLTALLPLLEPKTNRKFLESAQGQMKDWWELMHERGTRRDMPMKPQVVAWELGQRLAENAIFCADSGTIATWYARHLPVRHGQRCSLSGNLATMANGLPYAIAAQIAYPERQVVAMVGDGGFTMLMGEFATCVKYNLPVKVVVMKNNSLGQIKWEQMVFLGNPEYGCDLHPIDFAAFAKACGGRGYCIEDPATCGDILDLALHDPGPVLIEAIVDPHEPPLPPKISFQQAEKFAEALARGTPHRGRIALTVLADRVRELI